VNPLGKFPVFKHNKLTVVEVPLTDEEIEDCLKMGKKRTELDEQKLGWIYRHNGMASPRAHAIGFMGEVAVEKLFNSLGIERNKDYIRNNPFVEKYEDIKQDFTIGDSEVGVKSAENDSLKDATSYDSFLYPAKKEVGESKRVLPYPDFLIQTVVSVKGKKCWICGFVDKETITQSPIRRIVGKPAHLIPIEEYEPIEDLINRLMNR
jgi:hypothetical protein